MSQPFASIDDALFDLFGPSLLPVLDANIQCQGPCSKKHPPDKIVQCEAGHLFCFEDARTYTASKLGSGAPVLNCMNPRCFNIFSGSEVLKFIDLNIFKGFPKERLEVMIQRVGVKDLVEICPNCISVVVSGPISQNQLINCTNPSCKLNACSSTTMANRELIILHCR